MRAATDLMSEIEASRAKDIEAARASFAGRIEALELELAQTEADATNAAAAAARAMRLRRWLGTSPPGRSGT